MGSKWLFNIVWLVAAGGVTCAGAADPIAWRMHYQRETSAGTGRFHRLTCAESWVPEQTALIVCDMWDSHHCHRAVLRVEELVPRFERTLQAARRRGVTIIHAPSSCMEFYTDHPARRRALAVPRASAFPDSIDTWCHKIPAEEQGVYPVDQSQGGEDDEPEEHAAWVKELERLGRNPKAPWKRQHAGLTIDGEQDYLSDRGEEIWSILEARGIQNVILAGVHTNMCVLGRPFGLRRMVQAGKHTALMADLTDTMYDPRCRPFVSHFTGTDLIIDHIERHVCPTITSDQLIGGEPFRFSGDQRPTIAMLMAEDEYRTEETVPPWSIEKLGQNYRLRWIYGSDQEHTEVLGLEALEAADLLLVSVRRRTLKTDQLAAIQRFVAKGKPMLGIRTASHAFALRSGEPPAGTAVWPEFDAEVWGGHYSGHRSNKIVSRVTPLSNAAEHSILEGWGQTPFESQGSLYQTSPLAKEARPLLMGEVEGFPAEPVAWTFKRANGGRSFYTSLGHRDDFADPRFTSMLKHAVDWLLATSNQP